MSRPNVLLASVDSLRADVVYDDAPQTPFLDSLAADGVAFERCFSTGGWTAPAFVSMMTGEHPRTYAPDMSIGAYPETLAEVLREDGYRTVATLDANYWISEPQGFDRGFDAFENYVDSESFLAAKEQEAADDRNELAAGLPDAVADRFPGAVDAAWRVLQSSDRLFSAARRVDMAMGSESTASGAGRLVEDFTETFTAGEGPTFGWVHFMDVHHPYKPEPQSLRDRLAFPGPLVDYVNNASVRPGVSLGSRGARLLKRAYNRTVTELDEYLETLVTGLRSQVDGPLVVIVVGDHGEEFGEHGRFNHRNRPYTELVHVPLIVAGDGTGTDRVTRNTSLLDLKPAVEGLARGDGDVAASFQTTRPVCRCIHDAAPVAARTRQAIEGRETPANYLTVVDGDRKLHYDAETDGVERFDLESDFYEQDERQDGADWQPLVRAAVAHHVRERQELADQELVRAVDP